MAGKEPEVQEENTQLLMFMIAFNPANNSASFAGNMPVAQAFALIQQVVQGQQRDQMRKEIEAEIGERSGTE